MNNPEELLAGQPLHEPDRGQSAATIWAYVSIDRDGNEGILAVGGALGMMPAVFTKWDLVVQFKPLAAEAARKRPELRVVLRAYSQATDLEEL